LNESFFGFNIAVRGLFTAQKNLTVVNHNINNVNTPGYSRQQAVQVAARPMALFDGTGMLGTGSDITGIIRTRDEYLDYKYWSESIPYGEWSAKREILLELEVIFNEPSDSGFVTIQSEFFNALQELAKDPSSEAVRELVKQKGVSLAKYFNSTAEHLDKLQADTNYKINLKVEEINSLATQIQQLNRQIYYYELDGSNANDLRDRRTLLVDQLSKAVNIEANEVVTGKLPDGRDEKHFVITISGKTLVDHFNVSKLAVEQRESKLNKEEDIPGLYEVKWADGNELNVKGGELKGYLDVRDGNEGQNGSPIYKGIPYYTKKLNEFVRTFAKAFNEGIIDIDGDGVIDDGKGHADGYRLDSVEGDEPSGIRFFTISAKDGNPLDSEEFMALSETADIDEIYGRMTAKNFCVGYDVMTDISSISASDEPGEVGNIGNLNSIIKIRHNSHMFTEGKPEDFVKAIIATLGIDSQQAGMREVSQGNIIKQVANRRLSDSGVSLNEEMANLVKFQHAYNASAKMIQTMSEIYDILLNQLF
jgi:flagellar hook-associated protein 1 FlgK